MFVRDGRLLRQVNHVYRDHYDRLASSGLYAALADSGRLIPHTEVAPEWACTTDAYKVLAPEVVPFISYPYEWCFSQLKDAALTTLRIQRIALEHGMTLKDASAYNIQFRAGKPILIDSLSFETYEDGRPWVAYRQFCQHFLAPLALMSRVDIRLGQLLRVYLDGIPVTLASSLLPYSTYARFGLLLHLHLHARSERRFSGKAFDARGRAISRRALLGLLDSLEGAVAGLAWDPRGTVWANYYAETNYSEAAAAQKQRIVGEFLDATRPATLCDLGANTGVFSRVASRRGIRTVSLDFDPAAVERNYLECVSEGETLLLPLLVDVTNPSPGIGWENRERTPILDRLRVDALLALALVHHLAISNNLPLPMIAASCARLADTVIVEFVPKDDSQTQRLLAARGHDVPDYTRERFEAAFGAQFAIERSVAIEQTERRLYLMRRRERAG